MNELGLKEKAMTAVVAVVVMYAVAVGVWFLSAQSAWRRAGNKYAEQQRRFAKEEKLISERDRWDRRYESAKAAMPMFDLDKATDTTWLRRVEDLARTNLVMITKIDHGKEIEGGEVLELPIESDWEASLEALVKFMHALENSESGMFDIKELSIKPIANKPGYLRGTMSLTCAYMRKTE